MNTTFDTIIVGAGLAGAAAALYLSPQEEVLVLEAHRPAAGASGAAAGLVNPLMGRKAKAVWRIDDALDAFHETLDCAGATALFQKTGVLRPTVEAKQVSFFRDTADAHPHHVTWLSADAVQERFPDVTTHGEALMVRTGGAIRVPAFVHAMLDAAQRRGAEVRTGAHVTTWRETTEAAHATVEREDEALQLSARRVLLALGYGYRHHDELSALNLHGVKGQTVTVQRPEHLETLIPMSGRGYIVPDGDTLILGSSYEHDFDDLRPSPEQTEYIREKTARMVPGLDDADVLTATAGVRVMVPRTNLPLLGPLPGRERLWVFTGLGSKGLLTAPLLARDLPAFFANPNTIPPDVRVPT